MKNKYLSYLGIILFFILFPPYRLGARVKLLEHPLRGGLPPLAPSFSAMNER